MKATPNSQKQKAISEEEDDDDVDWMRLICQVRNPDGQDKTVIGISINGQKVDMEIDTGAAVTVLSEGSINIQPHPTYLSTLKICRVELCTELFYAIIPTLFFC